MMIPGTLGTTLQMADGIHTDTAAAQHRPTLGMLTMRRVKRNAVWESKHTRLEEVNIRTQPRANNLGWGKTDMGDRPKDSSSFKCDRVAVHNVDAPHPIAVFGTEFSTSMSFDSGALHVSCLPHQINNSS